MSGPKNQSGVAFTNFFRPGWLFACRIRETWFWVKNTWNHEITKTNYPKSRFWDAEIEVGVVGRVVISFAINVSPFLSHSGGNSMKSHWNLSRINIWHCFCIFWIYLCCLVLCAGMGFDAWDYQNPSQSDNDCVRSVWKMTCFTYFPRAEAALSMPFFACTNQQAKLTRRFQNNRGYCSATLRFRFLSALAIGHLLSLR